MLGTTQSVDLLMHANPPLQISAVPVPLVQEGISCDAVCFLFLTVIRFFFWWCFVNCAAESQTTGSFLPQGNPIS